MKASQKLIPFGGMTKKARKALGLRMCPDIGLWALDNGLGNCKWKTEACKDCYNWKMIIYPDTKKAWSPGGLDDQRWENCESKAFKGLSRVRLNTRGEAFPDVEQVQRVGQWIKDNPNTKFWIVTRAHQTGMPTYKANTKLIEAIEAHVMCHDNAKVMASLDEQTEHLWPSLKARGWNTIYYHRRNKAPEYNQDKQANMHKCRKTWEIRTNPETNRPVHLKGVCKTCRNGCFSDNRVDVRLKYHQ